jgi:superfamily I DNA and/or RNA helicase
MNSILSEVEQYLKIAASKSTVENGTVVRVNKVDNTISIDTGKKVKNLRVSDRVLIENASDFSSDFGSVADKIKTEIAVKIDDLDVQKYSIGTEISLELNKNVLGAKYLRKIIEDVKRGNSPIAERILNILEFKEENKSKFQSIEFLSDQLNDAQKRAIGYSIGTENFHLIVGPPGTGKTRIIAETVRQLVKRGRRKILIAAYTNLAVDNMIEAISSDMEVKLVRIGSYGKTNDEIRKYHIDSLIRKQPRYKYLKALEERMSNAFAELKSIKQSRGYEEIKIIIIRKKLMEVDQRLGLIEKRIQEMLDRKVDVEQQIQKVKETKSGLLDEMGRLENSTDRLIELEKAKKELNISSSPSAESISELMDNVVEYNKELSRFIMKFAFFGRLKAKKDQLKNNKKNAEKIIDYHSNLSKEVEHLISDYGGDLCAVDHEPRDLALACQLILSKKSDNRLARHNGDETVLRIQLANTSNLLKIWIDTRNSFRSQKRSMQADERRHVYIQRVLGEKARFLRMLIDFYHRQIREIEKTLSKNIMEESNIVAATTHASISPLLDMIDIDTVIMDEASQVSLINSIIPLVRADKFVLVGDDRQLEPIGERYLPHALNESVFTRLKRYHEEIENTNSYTFLDTQYRMNKEIADISSEIFYDNQLRTADVAFNRRLDIDIDDTVLSKNNSVVFIDFKGSGAYHITNGGTHYNEFEIRIIHSIISKMLHSTKNYEIGVITPYRLQRDKLKGVFGNISDSVEIDTVDRFQGREKDVIIFSFVRTSGNVGRFINNRSRLNVAITRARKKLIIVGNSDVLKTGSCTKIIFDKIEKDHVIVPYAELKKNYAIP